MDVIKKIDDLGRIAIPKEIRRAMHLNGGDQVKIRTTKSAQLVITKYVPNFSGQLEDLRTEVQNWLSENNYEADEKLFEVFQETVNRLEVLEHEYCRD